MLKEVSIKDPLELFKRIFAHSSFCYLLESAEGSGKLLEYSFIGFEPLTVVKVIDGKVKVENKINGYKQEFKTSDPIQFLRKLIPKLELPAKPRLLGGLVGYISYDCIRYWEKIPDNKLKRLGLPDLEFGLFADGIIFDHRLSKAYYYSFIEDRSHLISNLETDNYCLNYSEPKSNISKEKFESMVKVAKDYIACGDIFQVVLSRRYEFSVDRELLPFYEQLRMINPSPYMYYLKFEGNEIIGSSPEMLVRVEGKKAETYPIAGTRPLTNDEKENAKLARELITDVKERAEHIMLVDLARNDLGKVCKYGSVNVPEFMIINKYSHVQHIVSRVVGELKDNYDCLDTLKAVFPAGTVSGAPKVRAMEIIEELEPYRREVYAGAVGYFSFNKNADFAITIRTLISFKGRAFIQVGAGIVSDSKPENEWLETEHKAKALLKALEVTK